MFTLRADPWMPEYGMGFDVRFDEPPAVVEPFIETKDWSTPRSVPAYALEPVHFVDGVRRIDLRVLADIDGRRVPGLFGTYAAGSALCDARAKFEDGLIGRALVVGGGEDVGAVEIRIGKDGFRFDCVSTPGTEPDDPLLRLQDLMRAAESNTAARLAGGDGRLILVDGPLAFYHETKGPIVGVIKRFGRVYLEPEQGQLIPKLAPAQRTPLFAIGGGSDRRRRYAWYSRLTHVHAPWHDHAGVVRCEVRGSMPLDEVVTLADRVTGLLPRFTGRAQDPRTPQNLVPIAGLESWLRHRAGDTRLIRRALLDWIATEAAA